MLEAETFADPGASTQLRARASAGKTVRLKAGDSLTFLVTSPSTGLYSAFLYYSNDGPEDILALATEGSQPTAADRTHDTGW